MGLSTTNISERRKTINKLKEKHEELLQAENIEGTPKFIPKLAYVPTDGTSKVIAFFLSELLSDEDIYIEFVSVDLVPQDKDRTLWKWPYNPQFETAYEKSDPHPATGHCRYLIPTSELINVAVEQGVVEPPKKETPKEVKPVSKVEAQLELKIPEEEPVAKRPVTKELQDAPIELLTIKDKAAIEWRLPVSDKAWLNKLIVDNFKQTVIMTPIV